MLQPCYVCAHILASSGHLDIMQCSQNGRAMRKSRIKLNNGSFICIHVRPWAHALLTYPSP